ncbi:hypothetical protein HYALB_00004842 [Hymenoscyphus albidus]|uniref:Carboxylic ester hydrolase n=1 Tax=Hymenoscyphus albidus TaxID=595503 RepID=A0A9N9QC45_9HELO|nr:hypothetical protein HYALB_00004842 [Hymenoscyphus albidus]
MDNVMRLFIVLTLWCFILPSAAYAVGRPVKTSSGVVIGHVSRNRTQVSEYLGIRYAQAPVASLRFEPPLPYLSRTVFNASNYSVDCPSNPSAPVAYPNKTANFDRVFALFTGGEHKPQGEDCLKLNIWAKSNDLKLKAVLVWFHGGRFTLGSANSPFFHGQYMADTEDVIVVTINYRINIFEFSGAPGLTQNVGLLDQRLALEWLRDNISGFGGDPTKMTIFGQSAGGVAVDYHSYAWKSDPIVAGLISHSGTAASFEPSTPAIETKHFNAASGLLGCGTGEAAVPCMKAQNITAILAAVAKVPVEATGARPPPPFQPTVDNITVFSISGYEELAKAGEFAKLPYLAGNTNNEPGFYKIGAFAQGSNLTDAQWELFELENFTCATAIETAHRAAFSVPTWRYRYFGDWSNLRLCPGSGAYHGSDIEMVLGTAQDVSLIVNSDIEEITSRYMMRAWAAFAKNPKSGSSDYGWPLYENSSEETLVRLGYNNETTASFVSPQEYDSRSPDLKGKVSDGVGAF